jgi:hypothetical protein
MEELRVAALVNFQPAIGEMHRAALMRVSILLANARKTRQRRRIVVARADHERNPVLLL